jgi:hypothetical protein
MKRVAVIALVSVVLCLPSAWACQPQPYAPSEGLFDVLCDIVTAPCGLVAACLGVNSAPQQYANPCACPSSKKRCVAYVPEGCRVVRVKVNRPCVPPCEYQPVLRYPVGVECTPYVVVPGRPQRPPTHKADIRPPAPQPGIPEKPVPSKTPVPATTPKTVSPATTAPVPQTLEQPRVRRVPDIGPATPLSSASEETISPKRGPIPELTEPLPRNQEQPREVEKRKETPASQPEVLQELPRPVQPAAKEEPPSPKLSEELQIPRKPEVKPIEPGREVVVPRAAQPTQPVEIPQTLREPETPPAPTPPRKSPSVQRVTAPETGTTEKKPEPDVHMAPPGVDTRPVAPAVKQPQVKKKPAKKSPEAPCSPPCGPAYSPWRCY